MIERVTEMIITERTHLEIFQGITRGAAEVAEGVIEEEEVDTIEETIEERTGEKKPGRKKRETIGGIETTERRIGEKIEKRGKRNTTVEAADQAVLAMMIDPAVAEERGETTKTIGKLVIEITIERITATGRNGEGNENSLVTRYFKDFVLDVFIRDYFENFSLYL